MKTFRPLTLSVTGVLGCALLAAFAASCGTSKPARSDGGGGADGGGNDARVDTSIGNDAGGTGADGATADAPADLPIGDLPPASLTGLWSGRDIGDVGDVKGSLTASSAAFTIRGGGAAVGGTADAFFFTSQRLTGDGEIVARVKSLLKVMPGSQVGIMIRASDTDPRSPNVFLSVSGDPAADGQLQGRDAQGGATTSTAVPTAKEGQILRLVRTTKVVTAYRGDGQGGWTMIGVVEIDLPEEISLGLAISGADPLVAAAAELDLVRISNFARAAATKDWTLGELGTVGSSGIATADTITLAGLGERAIATTDVGVFVLQGGGGAQTITAKLASFTGGGAEARAGLIIREGASSALGTNTPFTFIGITPVAGTQFHRRSATGGISQAGALVSGVAAPAWIRLEKLDNQGENTSTFTGFFSSDGKQWNVLDSATFQLRAPYSIGLFLHAGSASAFAVATFSDISISAPK